MSGPPSCTREEFVALWQRHAGNATAIARDLGVLPRAVFYRRKLMEAAGYDLPASRDCPSDVMGRSAYQQRAEITLDDGVAVVWSDRHRWPGDGVTAAEAALLALLPVLDPDVLISNGDELDGARASKHPPLGWERKPDMAAELAEVQVGLRRIAEHAPRAKRYRTVGNHCRRYDYHLSKSAPDYRGIVGMRLSDHLPDWSESWSVHVNSGAAGGHCVIKHKIGNGVTAGRTNAIKAGTTILTGHTHRLSVDAIETYAGRHWGVQGGTLADTRSPAFEYGEDAPDKGRSGFVVLTWRAGVLQPPELCEVDDAGVAWFRGEPVTVKPRVRVRAGRAA